MSVFAVEDTTHPSQKFHHGTLEEQQSFNLTLLQPSTLYSIRVQAYNAKGASKLSEAVEARTEEDGECLSFYLCVCVLGDRTFQLQQFS